MSDGHQYERVRNNSQSDTTEESESTRLLKTETKREKAQVASDSQSIKLESKKKSAGASGWLPSWISLSPKLSAEQQCEQLLSMICIPCDSKMPSWLLQYEIHEKRQVTFGEKRRLVSQTLPNNKSSNAAFEKIIDALKDSQFKAKIKKVKSRTGWGICLQISGVTEAMFGQFLKVQKGYIEKIDKAAEEKREASKKNSIHQYLTTDYLVNEVLDIGLVKSVLGADPRKANELDESRPPSSPLQHALTQLVKIRQKSSTPIFSLSAERQEAIVDFLYDVIQQLLIRKNIEVNNNASGEVFSPLTIAVMLGDTDQTELVETLLDNGAQIDEMVLNQAASLPDSVGMIKRLLPGMNDLFLSAVAIPWIKKLETSNPSKEEFRTIKGILSAALKKYADSSTTSVVVAESKGEKSSSSKNEGQSVVSLGQNSAGTTFTTPKRKSAQEVADELVGAISTTTMTTPAPKKHDTVAGSIAPVN
jgi:hypothetical protein